MNKPSKLLLITSPSIAAANRDRKQKNRVKFGSFAMYPTLKIKISVPTNVTIRSITAESGSRTQPNFTDVLPSASQSKL